MMKKYFYFNCFNWIQNFNKTFWCSLISKLTHLFVYVQFIFSFFQDIACWFTLFSFVFSIVMIAVFRLLVKWFILLDFSFFSFYDYLCIFHQPSRICSKFYNWILFKLIFLYLTDFRADFFWLIPRHTKRHSAWWLQIFC